MTNDTFIARGPDGERLTLRVKRADDVYSSDWYRRQREIAERMNEEHLRDKVGKSFDEVMADADDKPVRAPAEHHASKVADLLVESGKFPHRAAALDHLLHHPRGAALLRRLSKQKDTSAMSDNWTSIAKDHGIIAVAKHVVENGAGSLNEHEFTALVTEFAKRQFPDMSPAAAFEKLFTAQTSDGMLLRQACALCKYWPAPISIEPMVSGGADGFPTVTMRPGSSPPRKTDPADGLGDAYTKLTELAEKQRRDGETAAAAFARVYAEPANRHLVEAERAQNRPSASGVRVVE